MNKEFKLNMVSMPNFLTIERPPGLRQDGFKPDGFSIPIATLSEEEARQYAEEMRIAFINHWKSKQP